MQDKIWTTAEQVKDSKMVLLISLLLDMERTGPELSCSNETPAHGKWFSSELWKFLNVQLCIAFDEKKNYIEI